MFTVRPYQDKDRENCREVCFVTSHGFTTEKKRAALYNLFCDYYLEFEKDTCFVAVNEKDEAIGYVICADDYAEYEKNYREHYLPALKKIGKGYWIYKVFDLAAKRKIAKRYPAHLHIDIKPEGQRQGLGHKLVDALKARLKEKGVEGVFLEVGKGNKQGISFYKKYGFKKYKEPISGIVYALDID
jgi:Acetyltransferases